MHKNNEEERVKPEKYSDKNFKNLAESLKKNIQRRKESLNRHKKDDNLSKITPVAD